MCPLSLVNSSALENHLCCATQQRARLVFLRRPFAYNEKAAPSTPLLCASSALVPTEAGDPAAEAQAGSAPILEEVNRPTVQPASSAASLRALFAEFRGR
jgi:hypothetical protein